MIDRLRKTDWLAVLLYPASVILMEAFWVSPWLAWVGGWSTFREPRPALSLGSVAITLALSLLLTRLLQRTQWPLRLIQAVTVVAGLVVILMVLGVEYRGGYAFLSGEWFAYFGRLLVDTLESPSTVIPGMLVLVYLWWRGTILGHTTALFRSIYRYFLLGLAALIMLLIFWRLGGPETGPGPYVGFYIMAFFFFGLLAIAVSHLYLMRRSMPQEEAALTSIKRWLPVTLGVIGGMVLIGFGAAIILSPDVFEIISRGVGVFFGFVGKIINYILIPLGYVVEAGIWLVRLIISWLRVEPTELPDEPGGSPFSDMEPTTLRELPPFVATALQWLFIAIVAAVVVYILVKAVSRIRGRGQEEIEEVHESLFTWQGFSDDLAQLLRSMRQRFQRKPHFRSVSYNDDDSQQLDIREIYRRFMYEATLSGLPRRRPETPSEYARRLERMVPESSTPLSGITEMYSGVRYGENAMREEQVNGANTLWRALRDVLRRLQG